MALAASRMRPIGDRLARTSNDLLDRLNDWDQRLRRHRPISTIFRYAEAPVTRDIGTSRFLVGPALLGFLATLMIAFGVAQPSSPFVLKFPSRVVLRHSFKRTSVHKGPIPRARVCLRRACPACPGLVRSGPCPVAHSGCRGAQTRLATRHLEHSGPCRASAVQSRHIQLRGPGRDGEPPHQSLLLRARDSRVELVHPFARRVLDQHPVALRAVLLADSRPSHHRVAAQCAGRRDSPEAVGSCRSRVDSRVAAEPHPEPRTRSCARIRVRAAEPGHNSPPDRRRSQRRPHGRIARRGDRGRQEQSPGTRNTALCTCRFGEGARRDRDRLYRVGMGRYARGATRNAFDRSSPLF